MNTVLKKSCQDRDDAPEQRSIPSQNSPLYDEGIIQSSAQLSALGLDEASRDAETFGDTGEATFNPYSKLPMAFHNGYYQPAEAAGPPAPHDYPTLEGNSLNRPPNPDSSPIFANTVLSENVRKRFLFTKNQHPRPAPTYNQESSGPGGHTRRTTFNYERDDFVSYGAGPSFKEDKRLEAIHEEPGTPLQGKSTSQPQNSNLSYNTPVGLTSKHMASLPSSTSTVPPPFIEPNTSERQGVSFLNPVPATRDRQAPGPQTLMDQDCGEGSRFLTEPLIPLRSFSPEKLVSRYQLDGPAPLPQEHLLSREPIHPAITHTRGESDGGPAGASPELRAIECAGNMTVSLSLDPHVEEFIARQRASARPRPPYWQTQCHWTIRPLGDAVGNCHYGHSCLYGHDGDVYEDNLSVCYTFENGRACPNFVSQRTLGPSLGARAPCSPTLLPDPPRLHRPQHGIPSHDQAAIPTEASANTDETLFRTEPLVSVADFLSYYENKYPALTIEDIIAGMEAQNTSNNEYTQSHVQGN
ncbi:unnamed protein product [Tuber aestivum]|uniref:Uncharacterized protein n=1 Tax=Tuber aestivum TaxID=59557 RepID=A0A292QA91_9PEZI|nr:unnamed protein product [Tuber aestivum]